MLLLVRPWVLAQEAVQRHQDPGGAKAALQRMISLECRLQNAEPIRCWREAFHGPDLAAVDLHREREAGARRLPSMLTVQAPHTPCSQPTWVPVAPNWCRRKSVSSSARLGLAGDRPCRSA